MGRRTSRRISDYRQSRLRIQQKPFKTWSSGTCARRLDLTIQKILHHGNVTTTLKGYTHQSQRGAVASRASPDNRTSNWPARTLCCNPAFGCVGFYRSGCLNLRRGAASDNSGSVSLPGPPSGSNSKKQFCIGAIARKVFHSSGCGVGKGISQLRTILCTTVTARYS
jgi:hypothetical protein